MGSFWHHVLLLRSAASEMCQRGNVGVFTELQGSSFITAMHASEGQLKKTLKRQDTILHLNRVTRIDPVVTVGFRPLRGRGGGVAARTGMSLRGSGKGHHLSSGVQLVMFKL